MRGLPRRPLRRRCRRKWRAYDALSENERYVLPEFQQGTRCSRRCWRSFAS
jgi:hypothetical protein